jgi:hypothetical protein
MWGSFARADTSSIRSALVLAIDACLPPSRRPFDIVCVRLLPHKGARLSRKATTQVKARRVASWLVRLGLASNPGRLRALQWTAT